MSSNEGLGRHFKRRHSLLRALDPPTATGKGRINTTENTTKKKQFDYSPIQSIKGDKESSLGIDELSLDLQTSGKRSKSTMKALDQMKILFTGISMSI
jgi:hypothetical protein